MSKGHRVCKHHKCTKVLYPTAKGDYCRKHARAARHGPEPVRPRIADRPELKTVRVAMAQSDHGTARSPDLGAYRVTMPRLPWE